LLVLWRSPYVRDGLAIMRAFLRVPAEPTPHPVVSERRTFVARRPGRRSAGHL